MLFRLGLMVEGFPGSHRSLRMAIGSGRLALKYVSQT
jgi:hypothetical protein